MSKKDIRIKFGTEGWRGVISDDFTLENVRVVARAVADYLSSVKQGSRVIVVGYDNRFLSERFAAASAGVFEEQGFDVRLSSAPVSTPNLCYAVRAQGAVSGIMITASHNPPRFNGIKVKAPYGGPVPDWVSLDIEKRIPGARESILHSREEFTRGVQDLKEDYAQYLNRCVDPGIINKIKKNVVFDYMYGSGSGYLGRFLKKDRIIHIRSVRDPLFGGINPEPIEANLIPLKKAVLQHKACAGIAVDGDADRIGIIDDKGTYLPPHTVFPLFLYYLAEYKKQKGNVVQTISLGYLSERIAAAYGFDFEEIPVGFKNVCERILKGNVLAGGEESGGYKVKGELPDRDGLLCGLVLLEMLSITGRKLSELVKELQGRFGKSRYLRKDITVPYVIFNKKEFSRKVTKALPSKLLNMKIKDVRDYDGVKIVLADDSWLLLRPSGTEPKVRIYSETPSVELTKKLVSWGVSYTLKIL